MMKRMILGIFLVVISFTAFAEGADNDVQGPNPEAIYQALDVPEWRVAFSDAETGNPIIGVNVFEKSVGGLLCRRSGPVVLEPTFTYTCYLARSLSNGQAMILYSLLDAPELPVQYLDPTTGLPRGLGITILEKQEDGLLCQRITAVVPNPVPTYTCYRDIELDAKELGKLKGKGQIHKGEKETLEETSSR